MKNITTFETARALKTAGFPQPKPEFGQIWYGPDGVACTFVEGLYWVCGDGDVFDPPDLSEMTFAPTAPDILREVGGGDIGLYCFNKAFSVIQKGFYDDPYEDYPEFTDSNPAEACALAWLEMKGAIRVPEPIMAKGNRPLFKNRENDNPEQ